MQEASSVNGSRQSNSFHAVNAKRQREDKCIKHKACMTSID